MTKEFKHFLASATISQLWDAYYTADDEGNITKRDQIETQIKADEADEERAANAQQSSHSAPDGHHQHNRYCEDAPCCGCCG